MNQPKNPEQSNTNTTGQDLVDILKEISKQQSGIGQTWYPQHPQPCPSCGHCPTCGRPARYTITYGYPGYIYTSY